jgi:hypothetical protein
MVYSLLNKQKHCLRIFRQGALRQDSVQLYTVALLLATETIKDRRVVHAVSLLILPETVSRKDEGPELFCVASSSDQKEKKIGQQGDIYSELGTIADLG